MTQNDINLMVRQNGFLTESVRDRYNAYGWHTALVEDGTDLEAIHAAIETAKASGNHLLIEVKTVVDTVLQTNKEPMPYTVPLLEQMKLQQLAQALWLEL